MDIPHEATKGAILLTRTRLAAWIVALAMLASMFGFTASAEDDTVNIEVFSSGGGSVTVDGKLDGEPQWSGFSFSAAVGETVTMTAEADEDFEFLFWVNQETERIVSRSATYSFVAATYAKIQAVFDLQESIAQDEDNQHTVVYLTEGDNIRYFESVELGDTDYYQYVPQNGLLAAGKTFIGWDHTPEQVAAQTGRVFVRPVYNTDISYVIKTYVGGVMQETQAAYGQTAQVDAPATLDGKAFSYWKAVYDDVNIPDQITSFYASYKFVVTMNATFVAVYGETVTDGIATRVSGDMPNFEGATISLYAEHSVKQGYTVLQHGMLLTLNESVGNFEDRFVIGGTDVLKGTANNTNLVGTYSIRKSNWYATNSQGGYFYPKLYARAYVVATDKSGVTHTVYSRIYCADYHERIFEGNDFEDPFGT